MTWRPQPRASRTSARSRCTKRPRTKVWTGIPVTGLPSKGVTLPRLCRLAAATVSVRARSTTAISACAPASTRPFQGQSPKARAGASAESRT